MDINQLRCFIATGEELHFGRAAQRMNMMPASLSRFIRLLEDDLGVRLLNRSTRNVSLTPEGADFLHGAIKVVAEFDAFARRFRKGSQVAKRTLRIGVIDSAARGLMPTLIQFFIREFPEADIHLTEDKTVNMLPRLKSGWLDIIFARPPENMDVSLTSRFITDETCVLAVPADHPLVAKNCVSVHDFATEAMIIPERKTRPHSHDLTMNIFKAEGLEPVVAQFAEEKQTILSFVAAGLGLAIVPASYKNMNSDGVHYIPLVLNEKVKGLPLSVIWHQGNSDRLVNGLLTILTREADTLTAGL
ncbi:LysR family transcriptional regulator [[Erwinia] mediterraneensis]|uniref:LysR family transcriptional regulator n=1 Tax=[Erwinia] mediterraneensis TaxID=2161819 RepID=UPI00102F2F82|nr:LysR family transcriptional regulator [[Erwinia] mediterraneensis]